MRARVVVDMTPLGPGGQNGGAGLVATSLVRNCAALAPDWEFVLLTSSDSHAELADVEAPNVRRALVRQGPAGMPTTPSSHRRTATLGGRALGRMPAPLRVSVQNMVWRLRYGADNARLIRGLAPDLLFCPFGAPYYWDRARSTKLVVVLHDLQHVTYPEFFSVDQRMNRDRHIRLACRRAQRIVCVSRYVRQTLVTCYPSAAPRAVVIPHGLLHEFPPDADDTRDPLEWLGVQSGRYLLYPANFWPHKNHRTLIEALVLHREQRPASALSLVCTGAPNDMMVSLVQRAERRVGPGAVLFGGYVPDQQFKALLDGCAALMYPSLYEGFGLPVLEAMARGKPVLCSNVTSLPEVAGDAAVYFDPTRADDIARAIGELDVTADVAARIARGRTRAAEFGSAADMACTYLALFQDVLAT